MPLVPRLIRLAAGQAPVHEAAPLEVRGGAREPAARRMSLRSEDSIRMKRGKTCVVLKQDHRRLRCGRQHGLWPTLPEPRLGRKS